MIPRGNPRRGPATRNNRGQNGPTARRGARAEDAIQDIIFAIALVIACEGLLFAAFPGGMKRTMQQASEMPETVMRGIGLAAAVIGVFLLWLIKAA